MVLGPGGCGKTFLYKALLGKLHSQGKAALAVASSGITALLLPNATTAHSRFSIPVDGLDESSTCRISTNTAQAEFI
jgi:ATP-dependent DNA helicase PIF1